MFLQLLRFEVFYQLKQRAFPLFAALFLFLGVYCGRQGFAIEGVSFNASYQINFYTSLFTLGSVFIVMFFAISGMLRDKRYNMEHLIYSTAIKKRYFFWSRFIGVFMFSLLAFSPYILGYILGVSFSDLDPERVVPFEFYSYVQPWLFFVVPNIFICATLVFVVASLTKNNTATYVGAIFIYMLYMISSIFLNSPLMAQSVPASPEAMALAALSDPFGIAAYHEQTQLWTPFQKNTQMLTFTGNFMWNRLLWIAISFGILLGTFKLFSFRKLRQKVKKEKQHKEINVSSSAYKTLEPFLGFKAQWQSFISLVKIELKGVFKSLPFIGVLLIWIFIVFAEIYSRVIGGGAYNDSLYPLSNLLIELFVDPLTILSSILIVFYSAELVWRERSLNFSGIIDAMPVSNAVFFLSKFVTLLTLPAILIISGSAIAICFQVFNGYFNIEIDQYLSIFYFYGIQLLFFSMLALFIQSIVKNKYLGMGLSGGLIVAFMMSVMLGVEHPLLSIGQIPRPVFTNMNGYSANTKIFNHLSIYWIAFGGILSLVSFKLWQRGIISSLKFRLVQVFSNWKKWEFTVIIVFVMAFFSAGATVFYNNNIINEYSSTEEIIDFRVNYERNFKQYESLERMYRVAIKTEVDIYPKEQRYTITSHNVLKNKEETPISKIFITERIPLQKIYVENATLIEQDTVFGTYLYEFNSPIQPQETVEFRYELERALKGYETSNEIVTNGSYITHRNFEPYVAYRAGLEISNNFERERHGLPKKDEEVITDAHLRLDGLNFGRVAYETTISTQENQTAFGSGELIKSWNNDGRNFYHFKSDKKILPTMAYFSADYTIKKEQHKGVSIEQYYDKAHDFNIDSIATSTKQALDYCIANFGDYPFKHLRIAEIPGHWGFGGFAHPGVISMVEDRLYLTDIRNASDFNLVAKRTIHEVAHQWWGHTLAPKIVEGGSVFVEGFAKYTEAAIMESVYGKRALYQLSQTANRRYFTGRAYSNTKEPSLHLVNGQSYLSYGKSYTVMLAIKELIGEEKLNSVLKTIADRYRDEDNFYATTLELLEELYKVTPEVNHKLINDWFRKVITYDLSIESHTANALENGQFELKIKLKSERFQTMKNGEKTSISIDEPIAIGVFTEHPSVIGSKKSILHYEHHQINTKEQEITFIVNELPKYIAIDPYATRSDENLVDNIIKL